MASKDENEYALNVGGFYHNPEAASFSYKPEEPVDHTLKTSASELNFLYELKIINKEEFRTTLGIGPDGKRLSDYDLDVQITTKDLYELWKEKILTKAEIRSIMGLDSSSD